MTRGVVPILSKLDGAAVTIGVNPYSSPPDVPKAFVWKDNSSNTDVGFMIFYCLLPYVLFFNESSP